MSDKKIKGSSRYTIDIIEFENGESVSQIVRLNDLKSGSLSQEDNNKLLKILNNSIDKKER